MPRVVCLMLPWPLDQTEERARQVCATSILVGGPSARKQHTPPFLGRAYPPGGRVVTQNLGHDNWKLSGMELKTIDRTSRSTKRLNAALGIYRETILPEAQNPERQILHWIDHSKDDLADEFRCFAIRAIWELYYYGLTLRPGAQH